MYDTIPAVGRGTGFRICEERQSKNYFTLSVGPKGVLNTTRLAQVPVSGEWKGCHGRSEHARRRRNSNNRKQTLLDMWCNASNQRLSVSFTGLHGRGPCSEPHTLLSHPFLCDVEAGKH